MTFEYITSDKLKLKMTAISKTDKALAVKLFKKIKEITSRDNNTIEFYKNLRQPMQEYKRVHIDPFVLTFKVYQSHNLILFDDLNHHDNIYK
ncbi:MAG: addiction module toxin RelE [Candidatus Micrarchaeota archaeon]